jgi:hypothetical protein
MSLRRKRWLLGAATAVVVVAGASALAVFDGSTSGPPGRVAAVGAASSTAAAKPVWTAVAWPFPADPWGKGKAFRCRPEDCGAEVVIYLRAKVGMCGCITSIDDDGVESGSDLALMAAAWSSQGPGRPIDVRWMKGRSRTYALGGDGRTPRSAVAVAFHDRCDMIVATAAVGDDEAARREALVIDFLNTDVVLRWAETTLGL